MSKDIIIIVRHGRPALSKKQTMDWRGFRAWWDLYDESGLAENQKLPKKVKTWAARADLSVSSPLKRARESAERALGHPPDKIDPDLVEAALPPPHLGRLRFRPKTWGTLARIVWYMGLSDGMESHKEAILRANRMAGKLETYASGGNVVFVTAHGWFNRMLKRSLKKRGWACVKQNGDLHWSFRQYERITQRQGL